MLMVKIINKYIGLISNKFVLNVNSLKSEYDVYEELISL